MNKKMILTPSVACYLTRDTNNVINTKF